MKVTRPDGSMMVMHDGSVAIENLVPKSIGIRNLSEIESFAVQTQDQTRIFRLDFVGGGHVRSNVLSKHSARTMKLSLAKVIQPVVKCIELRDPARVRRSV